MTVKSPSEPLISPNPLPISRTLQKLAWAALGYSVLVILWGAFVRATGSGAGCGDHWPLCDGQVIPREMGIQRVIEFTHRVTSGLSLVFVLLVSYLCHRTGVAKLRKPLRACVIFILLEAALGAGLVLFKLVAHDQSLYRVVSVSLHLLNTLCLVASQTVLAVELNQHNHQIDWPLLKQWKFFWVGVIGFFVIGATGALTALGDTLFPVDGPMSLENSTHILVTLRAVHPFMAIGVGTWIMAMVVRGNKSRLGYQTCAWVLLNWALGLTNVILMAPVWIQMVHLLVANMTWIFMIRYGLEQSRRSLA